MRPKKVTVIVQGMCLNAQGAMLTPHPVAGAGGQAARVGTKDTVLGADGL